MPLDLGRREVAAAAVDCLELAAVDRDDRLAKRRQVAATLYESAAGVADAGAVVASYST